MQSRYSFFFTLYQIMGVAGDGEGQEGLGVKSGGKDNITQVQFFQNLNLHWKFTENLSLYNKFPMEIKKFEKLKWSDIVFTANII